MPTSVREQVLQAVRTRLEAISPSITVFRNRHEEIAAFPSINLLDGDQVPVPEEIGVQRYDATIVLLGYVKVGGTDNPGPALNDLYATVLAAMLADVSLGDVAINITEGPLKTLADPVGDVDRQAQFDLELTIQYQTVENDPFSLG